MPKTGNISLYWKCQIAGWTLAGLYWGLQGYLEGNFAWSQGLAHFAGDFLVGILLTHAYRNFALRYKWHTLAPRPLIVRIVPAVLVLGTLYMFFIAVKLYAVRWVFIPDFSLSFWDYFLSVGLSLFSTGIRLMSIWILAYHMYHYARREINIAKANAQLSVIAKEAQLHNLAAQLNPHFLFNSLNNIKFLVAENPMAARRAIDLLSDLLRSSLYGKNVPLIALGDEINLVKDYLELEQLRFEERLLTNITEDETSHHIKVPPFSIQTLVENAVKHGIDQRKEGGKITVETNLKNGFLEIRVTNTGSWKAPANTDGLGIKNLRERLSLQYEEKASFNVTETGAGTVCATILIPTA